MKKDIFIDEDGIPCIVVEPGIFNEESRIEIVFVDFTTKQEQKEKDFITEVLEELEQMFKEMDKDASEEQ